MLDSIGIILSSMLVAATPLLLVATGEIITEKSGVLNLGLEGLMLIGAVTGFVAASTTGISSLGFLVAAAASALFAMVFAFLTQTLKTNQVATGLAVSIFGIGLSALIGKNYIGVTIEKIPTISIPWLHKIPLLGKLLFQQDFLVYFSIAMVFFVQFFLQKTRAGMILRAVGENHYTAYALGYSVTKIRYLAIAFGSAMAGIGGAYLSLIYTPHWAEGITAGRGWIALGLVVFATWKPYNLLLGSYIFGGILLAQLYLQGLGVGISPALMSMLPYAATILVLIIISSDSASMRLQIPACLGKPFYLDKS